MTIKRINKHQAIFHSSKGSNKYLQTADVFLRDHPGVIFQTDANESRKGVFLKYESGLYKEISTFEIEDMLLNYHPEEKHVVIPQQVSDAGLQEIIRHIKRRRFFYRDVFNQEKVMNFSNGYLNMDTGELEEHNMDIVSTIQMPYKYDKDADCPLYKNVINASLDGNAQNMMVLQEFAGYCLTKSTKFQKALFLIGASGSGKSTILDGIKYMIGEENYSSVPLDQLSNPAFTGNIVNKYANIDTEIPTNIENYENDLKKITTGEPITVNTKFIPTYKATPFCKLLFSANDMPRIRDTSNAIYTRLLLLRLDNVVSKETMDVDLKYKLKNEVSGIFNWAYEGLQRLNKNNKFTESILIDEFIEEQRMINNAVYYFTNEMYEITGSEEDWISKDDLYLEYQKFCHDVGGKGVFKKIVFGKEFKKAFGKKVNERSKSLRGVTTRGWTGVKEKSKIHKEDLIWDE